MRSEFWEHSIYKNPEKEELYAIRKSVRTISGGI